MECIFCSIVQGAIPSETLYEDEDTMAFLDIRPTNKGHTLIIPKVHVENLYTMDEHVLLSVMKTAQKVARTVKEWLHADGINLTMNNGAAAGQVVFHAHIHIIPRFNNDGHISFSQGSYKEGEAALLAQQLKKAIIS